MKKLFQCAWIGMVLLFLYAPILILAVYSFTESTMIGAIRGFSLQNYITLFTTPELLQMIFGTITLAFIVATFSTILGTAGAVGTFYSKKNSQRIIELVNQIPVVNADVVTGFSICILLIVFFNMEKESFIPLLVGQMILCTPFVYLQVMPRLQQMDPHLYEAALDLGCDTRQALIKVTLPQIWPAVLSGFMIGSLPVVYPWKEVLPGMYDYNFHLPPMGKELVIAIIMAIIGAILVLTLSYFSKRKEERMKRRQQRKALKYQNLES